ncbi:MAG: AMIN domain-containing protein, partial [Myxococcales bacterium]|nr:AMIN domain-containing protein [Myxococcales bacterium]
MVRSNTLRGALLLGGAALMAFVACANSPNVEPQPEESAGFDELSEFSEESGSDAASAAGTIDDVLVDRDGDITTVQLVGLSDPIYTAFRQHAPDRLVVDLPGVAVGDIVDSMAIYDGIIEDVSLETLTAPGAAPRTRLEVTLATEVEYDVEGMGDRFELRVWQSADTGEANFAAAANADPSYNADAVSDLASDASDGMSFVGQDGGGIPTTAEPAKKLTGIEAAGQTGGTLVTLWADGEITEMSHFVIDNPTRLVVDLPGLSNGVSTSQVEVGTEDVARLRVGSHADKVRVVLDANGDEGRLQNASFVQTSKGLTLVIGDATPTHEAFWPFAGTRPAEYAAPASEAAEAEPYADELAEAVVAASEETAEATEESFENFIA